MVHSCKCGDPSNCSCKSLNQILKWLDLFQIWNHFISGKKTISKTDDSNIENPEFSNSNSDPYDSPRIEPKKNDSNTDPYDSPVSPKKGPNKSDLSKLTATGIILDLATAKINENLTQTERNDVKDQNNSSDSSDDTISEISSAKEDNENKGALIKNKK